MSYGFNEYQSPQAIEPPKSNSTGKILLLFGGLGLAAIVVCCGGGAGLMYAFGNIMSADVEMQLRDHPQIREHVGEIQSLEMNLSKSLVIDGDDIWIYDVEGSNGRGELTIESISDDAGDEIILSASLRLSTGEVIVIVVE